MKKIACFIENYNILQKVQKYSELEEIDCVNFVDNPCEIDYGFIFYITDVVESEKKFDCGELPIVIIGQKESKKCVYELSESFDIIQFRMLIDTIYHGGKIGFFSDGFYPKFIHKEFIIRNNIFEVDKIVYNITKELSCFCSISDIQKLRIGLSEIITNGIEHGNLEITGDEKFESTEKGTYTDMLNERLQRDEFSKRYVTVNIFYNNEYFEVRVTDMGKGFNVKKASEKNEDDLLKLHGRGIMIAKMYFDEIEYNEKGNSVKLYKRFKC
ncbi:MAG: hypothetical protein JG762_538 [Deferribacteraceae bacterium]|jgi:anti-sigma regulatory factor (Ser/Thr protein kinase)|nr:hypothetical protein [Deferribacteraceae bacterium]